MFKFTNLYLKRKAEEIKRNGATNLVDGTILKKVDLYRVNDTVLCRIGKEYFIGVRIVDKKRIFGYTVATRKGRILGKTRKIIGKVVEN